jgi:hypothetical protein
MLSFHLISSTLEAIILSVHFLCDYCTGYILMPPLHLKAIPMLKNISCRLLCLLHMTFDAAPFIFKEIRSKIL